MANSAGDAALTGITAAVGGVIANLGLFFAISMLCSRTVSLGDEPMALQLPVASLRRPVPARLVTTLRGVFVRRWTVLRVRGACAVLGLSAGLLLAG